MPIPRRFDSDFFKTWSREMSYVLGVFAADGNMRRTPRDTYFIEFQMTDRSVVGAIKKFLKSNHKISIRPPKNIRCKISYRIQIGSKEIFKDLSRLGFTVRKSLSIRMPEIPDDFFPDFLRGYFDGDGCVYLKRHFVPDRQKKRWVFSVHFTSGSYIFLQQLKKRLSPWVKKGFIIHKQKSGHELIFSHRDSAALFTLMYNNTPSSMILFRKFSKYRKAVGLLALSQNQESSSVKYL